MDSSNSKAFTVGEVLLFLCGTAFAIGAWFCEIHTTIFEVMIGNSVALIAAGFYAHAQRFELPASETSPTHFKIFEAVEWPVGSDLPLGWVYVIQEMDFTGYCKIGKAEKLSKRMKVFDVKLPFRWQLVAVMHAPNAHTLERRLHDHFVDKHVLGEWFNLSAEDVAELRKKGE